MEKWKCCNRRINTQFCEKCGAKRPDRTPWSRVQFLLDEFATEGGRIAGNTRRRTRRNSTTSGRNTSRATKCQTTPIEFGETCSTTDSVRLPAGKSGR